MFSKIVIGVDENDGSCDAIKLARRLAAPDAEFTLVNVYPEDLFPVGALAFSARSTSEEEPVESYGVAPYRTKAPRPRNDAVQHLNSLRLIEKIAAENDMGEAALVPASAHNAGRGIRRVAEQVGAELIALGSRHGTAEGRVDLNDGVRAVLSDAQCAVAIAPAGYVMGSMAMTAIGVGYDGGVESRSALAFTRTLAAELDASLFAIEVVDFTEYAYAERFNFSCYELEEPLMSAVRDEIPDMPGVEGMIKVGFTEVKLTEVSSTVDLLVLGSRGYGPLGRLIHGSTTLQMAHNSRCPLLLLRGTTRAPTRTPVVSLSSTAYGAAVSALV